MALEEHFAEEQQDFVWILNVDDYINQEVPEWLNFEVAE
jgi:hypothetical protein